MTNKRGRPAGVKNKPKNQISEFKQALDEWDRMESESNKVNYEELCQKLQEALAKSYCDFEQLEHNLAYMRDEIIHRDIIIRYLENRAK